jgi:acetyl-CoA carboxylase biotin carboxyl carrier protein
MTEPRDQAAPQTVAPADAGSEATADAGRTAAPPDAGADDAPTVSPADRALFEVIDRLAAILDHSDLIELEIQAGSTGLTLRKPVAIAPPAVAVGPGVATGPGAGPAGSAASAGAAQGAATEPAAPPAKPSVKAPLTGIWYGSPAPGSAPYVQIGSEVNVGTVIGLIEAMKLFNEIKSDIAGRVTKVIAEHGKLVKAKQPLIEVEPL